MLDVNCAWPVPEACGMADALREDGLAWLEEPVWPPEDCNGLARVRQRGIPIAAGENVAGVFGFQSLIDAKAIDIAQPSVAKIGGIGEMLRVIDLKPHRRRRDRASQPIFRTGLHRHLAHHRSHA